MPGTVDHLQSIRNLARRRGSFRVEAYLFVLEALDRAMPERSKEDHISGEELLGWIRQLGGDRYGVMTGEVFNAWGVRSTLDFGRIVFHLVDEGLLRKRDEDSLSDFIDKFDFENAFALKVFESQG